MCHPQADAANLDHYEDILRLVCHHLELPQSESGPADDIRLYDDALEALDLYACEADRDLAENRRLRFKAEADLERLLAALEPVIEAASRIPDPRDIPDGSAMWCRMTSEFSETLAGLDQSVFRTVRQVACGIRLSAEGATP